MLSRVGLGQAAGTQQWWHPAARPQEWGAKLTGVDARAGSAARSVVAADPGIGTSPLYNAAGGGDRQSSGTDVRAERSWAEVMAGDRALTPKQAGASVGGHGTREGRPFWKEASAMGTHLNQGPALTEQLFRLPPTPADPFQRSWSLDQGWKQETGREGLRMMLVIKTAGSQHLGGAGSCFCMSGMQCNGFPKTEDSSPTYCPLAYD